MTTMGPLTEKEKETLEIAHEDLIKLVNKHFGMNKDDEKGNTKRGFDFRGLMLASFALSNVMEGIDDLLKGAIVRSITKESNETKRH